MQQYQYEGPVMSFETCVRSKWIATTSAISEKKAKSNLVYRYKRENGLLPSASIRLPGKIVPIS